MERTITCLTPDYGTALYRAARNTQFPEKVGKKEFTAQERVTFFRWQRKLARRLFEYSDIPKKDKRYVHFGPMEWYTKEPASKEVFEKEGIRFVYIIKEEHLNSTLPVTLQGDAECKMAYLLAFLWLHPESKHVFPPGIQDDFAWPFVAQLGKKAVAQMETEIGLAENKGVEVDFSDDDEPVAATRAEEDDKED